jgi:NAD(P)-dependent dehydrogenase (short-subunit alcohol dehydrogenase family)
VILVLVLTLLYHRAKLKQEDNLEVKYVHLDVEDEESIKRAKDVIEREEGRLDVLINNAGTPLFLDHTSYTPLRLEPTRLRVPLSSCAPSTIPSVLAQINDY